MGLRFLKDQRAQGGAGVSGLRGFFNEYFNFRHIGREKRKYKQQEQRVEALPDDYRYVYRQIQQYMWGHSGGSGMDMLPIFTDLLDLFETGVAEGKPVLAVTGEDVAAFCDELLRNVKTWTGKPGKALNRDIQKKLGQRHGA
jgi:DNA-binding ferritin-like protein (Dps family)